MARILCTVRKDRDGYRPYVIFNILKPGIYLTVDAVVDTGSPFTVLSAKDALSSRLPISTMRSGQTVGLVGCTFFRHEIGTVVLHFRAEDGKLVSAGVPSLSVLVPTKMDKETLKRIQLIPGLVGTDLLRDQRWRFYFDPAMNQAYLEIP